MNDDERELWVLNDPALHYSWKNSKLSIRQFIRQNRQMLTELITARLKNKSLNN